MTHEHNHQQYTCPMHPEIIKDAPGQCPKCGMTLVPLKMSTKAPDESHEHHEMSSDKSTQQKHNHHHGGGHAHHAGMIDDFKMRFYVVLILTIPIMALSPMIQHWLNTDWSFTGSKYILLTLSSIVFFYGGWP